MLVSFLFLPRSLCSLRQTTLSSVSDDGQIPRNLARCKWGRGLIKQGLGIPETNFCPPHGIPATAGQLPSQGAESRGLGYHAPVDAASTERGTLPFPSPRDPESPHSPQAPWPGQIDTASPRIAASPSDVCWWLVGGVGLVACWPDKDQNCPLYEE